MMRWSVAATSLPWILVLSCPQGGTFVLTLPACLRRRSRCAVAVGQRLEEGERFGKDLTRASWIGARGGNTDPPYATMRNERLRRKFESPGDHREGDSPTAGSVEAIPQHENAPKNGNPLEAVAAEDEGRHLVAHAERGSRDGKDRSDGEGGNGPSTTNAATKQSAHLKLREMYMTPPRHEGGDRRMEGTAEETSSDSSEGSHGDADNSAPGEGGAGLPPGTVRLLEYRLPGGENERFVSIGGDVSKFALYLDSAVCRGVLEPPTVRMPDDGGGMDGEAATLGVAPTGGGRSSDNSLERRDRYEEEGTLARVSDIGSDAATADGELAPAGNHAAMAVGRWATWITASTVEVADERVQESLKALWKAERLVSQERDATNVLRAGEACFSELLASFTTRIKLNHWENIPPRRLLDVLEEYDPEVRSRCGFDPDRSDDETLSLLKALLEWFKKAFPYYYDGCQTCYNRENNTFVGYVYPTEDERAFRASSTELYHCSACGATSRFPRYAAVSKVLETRRGRCGEYSVLMLRLLEALGYECRWVVDWSDHVWVEARVGERWVHVDPCEAAVDEPLLYEAWGKNQTYILAFTPQEVVDVTDKYTSDFGAAEARRDMDPEKVEASIADATKILQDLQGSK